MVVEMIKAKLATMRRYSYVAAFLLCLRYSQGRLIWKNERLFMSLPHFIKLVSANFGGWLFIYFGYLFTKYHPVSGKRFYDYSPAAIETSLYSPEELKNISHISEALTKTLSNGDYLHLTNEENLIKTKDELVSCYDSSTITSEKVYREENLVQLFDFLPAIDSVLMIGKQFDGFVIPCQPYQYLNLVFPPNQWAKFRWGKVYFSRHEVDPVVVNYEKKYYFSVPSSGPASVMNVQFRNKVTSCMIYDSVAVKDYFVNLRNDTKKPLLLLGMFMIKEKLGGFFILKEDADSIIFS